MENNTTTDNDNNAAREGGGGGGRAMAITTRRSDRWEDGKKTKKSYLSSSPPALPEREINSNSNSNVVVGLDGRVVVRGQGNRAGMMIKKKVQVQVQVVYYLTRNGQLEHPHFMEISHLANHHLRLKDFTDRLTLLRGKGIPSQYSWSCKRSYKNGYVWNDLTDNDIIYPSEGAEYILKGSEIIHQTDFHYHNHNRVQHQQVLQVQKTYNSLTTPNSNSKLITPPPPPQPVEQFDTTSNSHNCNEDKEDDEDEIVVLDEEKNSYTSSANTPTYSSRCSRGVSTDELNFINGSGSGSTPNFNSKPTPQPDNYNHRRSQPQYGHLSSSSPPSPPGRSNSSSVLLQLIACGGSVAAKGGKSIPCLKQQQTIKPLVVGVSSNANAGENKRKDEQEEEGAAAAVDAQEEEEKIIIKYMSENPRFGNLQSEDKEYFSGSILEANSTMNYGCGYGVGAGQVGPALLKKSSSYKEDRRSSSKITVLKETLAQEAERVKKEEQEIQSRHNKKRTNWLVKGKCIPNTRRKNPNLKP